MSINFSEIEAKIADVQTRIKKKKIRKSDKALSVAYDVLKSIEENKRLNLKQIAVNNGYSETSALAQKPYQTDTFKYAVAPVINKMRKLHQKALDDLDNRDLSIERIDSVINLSRQMVHDTQLLEGKSTENHALQVMVYNADDVLSKQVEDKEQS